MYLLAYIVKMFVNSPFNFMIYSLFQDIRCYIWEILYATSWKHNLIYKTTVPLAQRLLIKGSCPSSWADRPASKVFGKKSAAVLRYSAWATKRCRTSDPERCRTSLCSHTVSDHPAVAVLEQYSILERKKRRRFSSTAHGRMGLWPFTLTFSAKVALCVSGS